MDQRGVKLVVLEALGAVAHAVLDAEIDAETDEQHGEGDRQEVQRADHQQAETGGDRQADDQRDEYRDDDLRRMQRQPQDHQHHQHRADAVGDGAILNRGEFFVGGRYRTGEADPRRVVAGKVEIARGFADRVGRVLAGFQRVEIEDRLQLDKRPLVRIRQRLVIGELAPREGRRSLVEDLLDGAGNQRKWPGRAVELELPALDALEPGFQRAGQAANARVAGTY